MQGNLITGARYLFTGFKRLNETGIRRYVAVPISVNILLMSLMTWWGVQILDGWITSLSDWVPSWLSWSYWVIMPLAVIILVGTFAYFFSTLLVVLMAPFNGLLSEEIDKRQGNELPNESLKSLILRTFSRELIKLAYLLPRYFLLFLLHFVPFVGVVAPLLWLLFTFWVVALQYGDYSFDNRQFSFKQARLALKQQNLTVLGFGAVVMFLLTIPIVNWFVIPAAIIGATQMNHEQKILENAFR